MRIVVSPDRTQWLGIAAAVTSAVLFGASTPLAKLYTAAVNPWLLAATLYGGAAGSLVLLSIWSALLGRTAREAPLRRKDIPWLTLATLAGGVGAPLCLLTGLQQTSAATTSLLLNLEGVATMGIAWWICRENTEPRMVLGAAAILAGAVVLSWPAGGSFITLSGALWIAAACIGWGADNNLTRRISGADPMRIALIKTLTAGLIDLLIARSLNVHAPSLQTMSAVATIGAFGYGASLVFFVYALRLLGAARTGAYFALAPFVGVALAVAMYHVPLTLSLLLAAAFMAFGVWLHLIENHSHEHVHEPLEHEHLHTHDLHHQHVHQPGDPPGEPHSHVHRHEHLRHRHAHYPDLHHRHDH